MEGDCQLFWGYSITWRKMGRDSVKSASCLFGLCLGGWAHVQQLPQWSAARASRGQGWGANPRKLESGLEWVGLSSDSHTWCCLLFRELQVHPTPWPACGGLLEYRFSCRWIKGQHHLWLPNTFCTAVNDPRSQPCTHRPFHTCETSLSLPSSSVSNTIGTHQASGGVNNSARAAKSISWRL